MNELFTPRRQWKRHGLVAQSDGARPIGWRDAESGIARLATLLMLLVGILGVFCWWMLRESPSAVVVDDPGTARPTVGPVRLAPEIVTPGAPPIVDRLPVPDEVGPAVAAGVEDMRLGGALAQPKTISSAPPSPPRASVDPEPSRADDPSDFELPVRQ